ncbi:MAG: 23S rRNA (guanosine(2251)-2'-O)-methyltransferase RlmB [Bacteroidales bacterium]|nr:23S rRNA (guanosine(2251)-2'-O)-methyltransferase RlmB [Bacteroidales bacterium]
MEIQDYIFGLRPIKEAIESGRDIEKIWVSKGLQGDLSREVMAIIRKSGIPYQMVPVEKLNRLTRKNHQGIVAITSLVTYQPFDEVIASVFESGRDPLIIILDHLTDVRNLGAIARSAEAAGADAIVVPEKGSAQINADAMKTSAGALSLIPVCRTSDLKKTIRYLKNAGLQIAGATEKTDLLYYQANLSSPLALIMGAEDTGIDPELLALCDQEIRIPMLGRISSLNVSAAASVILFEIVRQRSVAGQ